MPGSAKGSIKLQSALNYGKLEPPKQKDRLINKSRHRSTTSLLNTSQKRLPENEIHSSHNPVTRKSQASQRVLQVNGIRDSIVEIDRLSAPGKEKELEAKKQELA